MASEQKLCGPPELAYDTTMKFHLARLTFSAFLALFFLPFGAFANSSLQADEALEADNIAFDEAQGTIDASGNVTLSTAQGMLRTGRLIYDRTKGRLDVSEPMVFDQTDGTRFEAAHARLDDTLDNASFTDLRLTPLEGGSFAARTAKKIGTQLTLQGAVFTSCSACEDPDAAPLWQIRAARIRYDRAAQNISYAHSRLELYGLPIFTCPIWLMLALK
jgi:LPS-assembly protein